MSREDRLKKKARQQARQQARKNKLAIGLAMLEGYGHGTENARSRDRKAA